MKKILTIAVVLFSLNAFSQKKEAKVAAKFQDAYNVLNAKAIHNLFSEEKQTKNSLEQTERFYKRIHASRGNIKDIVFVRKQKEYFVFKTIFNSSEGELVVKLNNKGKADILATRSTVFKK